MTETCVLDVADSGGATLEQVGELMGVTRERIRQIEMIALSKLQRLCRRCPEIKRALLELLAPEPPREYPRRSQVEILPEGVEVPLVKPGEDRSSRLGGGGAGV